MVTVDTQEGIQVTDTRLPVPLEPSTRNQRQGRHRVLQQDLCFIVGDIRYIGGQQKLGFVPGPYHTALDLHNK